MPRAATGTRGLDFILGGGLARNWLHLLEGSPGVGKTTIALQFLMAVAALGEAGTYVSLAETEQELCDRAALAGVSEERIIGKPYTDNEFETKVRDALSVPSASDIVRLRS